MPAPRRTEQTLEGTEIHAEDDIWWEKPEKDIGSAMVAVARRYETAMQPRRDLSRTYVALYKGQRLGNSMMDAASPRENYDDAYPCWNVVQAAINTSASVIIRNRVRVQLMTNGADYDLQEVAKDAELAIQGAFQGNKVYEKLDSLWFLDAAAPGLGCLMTEADRFGNTVIRRVIPDGIIFNVVEAMEGNPRQIFVVEYMSKYQAIAEFATDSKGKVDEAKKEAINAVTAYELPLLNNTAKHIPLVPIYRGWYLPSYKGAKDGRFVVGIAGQNGKGATLRYKEWKHMRFPLSFLHVERSPAGLWGIGMAERLAGFQYRLNELNMDIELAARLASVGKWMVDTGSNVNDAELDNTMAGIVHYTGGTPPKFQTIDGIPRDLLTERDTTYAQALKEYGLSEWTVAGEQPENIESGEGLRTLRDQEQGRAIPAGQFWEAAHVDLAESVLITMADALEEHPEAKVMAESQDDDGLTAVELKTLTKILSDPDAVVVRPFPTSILPTQPAAKFEKLREWLADGTIDPATFAALSDMPDTNAETELLLAGVRAVRRQITNIVRKGHAGMDAPDETMPLDYAFKLAINTRLKGMNAGMPEEKQQLLLDYAHACLALKNGEPFSLAKAMEAPTAQTGPVAASPLTASTLPQPGAPPAGMAPAAAPVAPGSVPPAGAAPGGPMDLNAVPAPPIGA